MAPPLDVHAMDQLQSQQSKLLDKIDELRAIGVGTLVELPQLIVCGNQSSGKSSVLEAISRVRFPAKSNVCTRFATEVVLRRNPQSKIKVSIEPGASRTNEKDRWNLRNFTADAVPDSLDLPALIERAKTRMGIHEGDSTNSGFSDDVLKIEIWGPDKPELTLVDLPGLYYSTSRDQGEQGIRIVRGLTEKYMRNTRSIILAVISAKTDYHLQEVLNIAERFDPKRERTLGIITQPDILEAHSEEESNYLQFMQNKKISLRLGWHALRNRSFETRDISDNARDEREKEFFEQGRWSTISREHVGIESLRRRLSSILLQHVQRNLPDLIADIRDKISDRQQSLSKLGSARSTLQQQRGYLLNISSKFERITSQALNGMYADEFFDGSGDSNIEGSQDFRRLRAIIRELNECFADAMDLRGCRRIITDWKTTKGSIEKEKQKTYMENWSPEYVTRQQLEKEISEQARKNRGIELPGNANQLLVGSLFRDQSKPWEGVSYLHLMNAWEAVKYFVCLLLRSLTDDHTYSLLLSTVLATKLERMKEDLLSKLRELTAYIKRGHPLPVGKSFLSRIQKARKDRELLALQGSLEMHQRKTGQSGVSTAMFSADDLESAFSGMQLSSDEFAAAEIIDQMQAYYDTSIVTFVDNVATLAIENCLLGPLEQIFTSQTVNNMDDQQIQGLAAEPSPVQNERERLDQELEKLRAGLNAFNIFSTEGSSLQRPSIFGKPVPEQQNPFPDRKMKKMRSKPPIKLTESASDSSQASSTSSGTVPLPSFETLRPTANDGPFVVKPSSSQGKSLFGGSVFDQGSRQSSGRLFGGLGTSSNIFTKAPEELPTAQKKSAQTDQMGSSLFSQSNSSPLFASRSTNSTFNPKSSPTTEGSHR